MKNFILIFFSMIAMFATKAQNVGIGTNDPKARLDIVATNEGFLIPRVALTATNVSTPLTAPEISELVYNTATVGTAPNNVTPGYYYWDGAKWIAIAGSGGKNWSLTGNAGTTASTAAIGTNVNNNFIGTTDNVDFVVATNNYERLRILNNGQVGINVTSITQDYSGGGNGWRSFEIRGVTGNAGSGAGLLQLSTASDDADGTQIGQYSFVDRHNTANAPSTDKTVAQIVGFSAGTTANKRGGTLSFSTKDNGDTWVTERMRITNNGNVGIGLTTPIEKLNVAGNVRVGEVRPNGSAGTGTPALGDKLIFSGANPMGSHNSDNSDEIWMARYNINEDVSELRINLGDNPTNPSQQDAFVVGSTNASNVFVPAFTIKSTGRIEYTGRTEKHSNTFEKYRIMFGGAQDQNWKTIANVTIGANLYSAVAFEVTVLDAMTNFGHTADAVKRTYYVSMTRSIATLNDPNNAVCKGPTGGSGYLRAVKTATGVYELQVRQPDDWKHIHIEAQVISELSSTVNYVDNLANGSGGTIYTCP